MIAGGMFWYWNGLPKQAPTKKNSRAADIQGKTPLKKSQPAHAPGPSSKANNSTTNRYRAVSVHCPSDGCAAAKALGSQRFLAREAPVLPLPGCDHAACPCSYAHHADQRATDDDRRSIHGLQTELYTRTAGSERRNRRGRRKGDSS
jgi:hypothetical protein